MAEELDELVVRVRADAGGVKRELDAIKREVEGPLASGLDIVGGRLETALRRAVRTGKFSLDDLKRTAMSAMDAIAAASLKALLPTGKVAGINLRSILGSILGLPGRATGGPVSQHRPYLVGERGPEVFVPEGAGRVEPMRRGGGAVNVSVALTAPVGEVEAPILARSRRQLAASISRAVKEAS